MAESISQIQHTEIPDELRERFRFCDVSHPVIIKLIQFQLAQAAAHQAESN
jgi:hypothetical protein